MLYNFFKCQAYGWHSYSSCEKLDNVVYCAAPWWINSLLFYSIGGSTIAININIPAFIVFW